MSATETLLDEVQVTIPLDAAIVRLAANGDILIRFPGYHEAHLPATKEGMIVLQSILEKRSATISSERKDALRIGEKGAPIQFVLDALVRAQKTKIIPASAKELKVAASPDLALEDLEIELEF